jgi:hypothetical protein
LEAVRLLVFSYYSMLNSPPVQSLFGSEKVSKRFLTDHKAITVAHLLEGCDVQQNFWV